MGQWRFTAVCTGVSTNPLGTKKKSSLGANVVLSIVFLPRDAMHKRGLYRRSVRCGWLTECVSVTFLSKVTSHDITLQCLKFVELADFLIICSNKNIALRNLQFDFGVVNTTYDDC